MSTYVTYDTDHISVLHHSTLSNALTFCFFMYVIVIQKKNIILEEI